MCRLGGRDHRIENNKIFGNFTSTLPGPLPDEFKSVLAFGGIILASASNVRIHDNLIAGNGGRGTLMPVSGVYILHGENVAVENNRILDNGFYTSSGTLVAGIRAGIALQLVGRVGAPNLDELAVDSDSILPAARIRGNTVTQAAGRALQMYGLGPMVVSDNVFVSQGLGYLTTVEDKLAHCIDIHNLGQSSDLVRAGFIPALTTYIPAPPIIAPVEDVSADLIDGRILFTNNQIRFQPVAQTAPLAIYCATRLTSYGDIGVHNNQFFTQFPNSSGKLRYDTVIACWWTRTINNRWEDPAATIGALIQTDVSAFTIAAMNITTLNQATRCIEVEIVPDPSMMTGTNPIDINQTYHPCAANTLLTDLFGPQPAP